MYKYLISSAVLAFAATATFAQDQSSDPASEIPPDEDFVHYGQSRDPNGLPVPVVPESFEEGTITVTADGLSIDIRNTGQAVTVIEREEIEAVQGPDISRVLARAPSLTVTRNGALGGFTGVSLRGANADQLLVLIDGVRVTDPAAPGGGFDWGTIASGSIGKLDILRSSNSTIWGSEAIGGVIDISSRGTKGLNASAEFGARDTLSASLAGGLEGDRYFIGLGASYLDTDGFSSAAAGTERDGFEQIALSGSAFVDLSDRLEAFASFRWSESDAEIDGFSFSPPFGLIDTEDSQETRRHSGAIGLAWYGNDLTVRTSYALADTERDNLDASGVETFTSEGKTEQLSLRGEYRLIGGLSVAFGGQHEWSSYETLFDSGADTEITGGYVQLGWESRGLSVRIGSRVDDHQRFGTNGSYGGDISYRLGDSDWRIKASLGEGFKAPTLFQLFSDFGNAALAPEESTSFDLGIERGVRGSGSHFAARIFRRDSEDLINFVSCFGVTSAICVDRPFGTYDNVARARAQGFEVEGGFEPVGGLRLAGHYSLIDTEDRTTGNELARRPRHAATFYADYTSAFGLSLGADLRIVGKSFDDAGNFTRLDGYELVDLRASFDLNEQLTAFGRIENVFDTDYQTAAGYAQAGRGVFAGIRAKL